MAANWAMFSEGFDSNEAENIPDLRTGCVCGSDDSWYDRDAEAYFCSGCNGMIRREHSTGGNWETLGEEGGSHNSCGNQFLPDTCSRVYVAGNRALSRLELHSSSNNHETSMMKTWEKITRKTQSLPAHYREKIKSLYGVYYRDHLNRDKVKWGIIAALARYTCLLNGTPYTNQDLARMFGIPTKKLHEGITRTREFLQEHEASDDLLRAQETLQSPDYLILTYGDIILRGRDQAIRRIRDTPATQEQPPLPLSSEEILALCRRIIECADHFSDLACATSTVLAAAALYAVISKHPLNASGPELGPEGVAKLFDISHGSVTSYSNVILRRWPQLTAVPANQRH